MPPGDPASLTAAAGTFTAVHGTLERARGVMNGSAGHVGGAGWIGVGATSCGEAMTRLASGYQLTATSLARGATTLRTYAAALTTAKETARQANAAVETTNATATKLLAAQGAAATAQTAATTAAQTSTTATAHATANPHSPAAATASDQASRAATDASNAATAAQNQVTTLTAQYETERARALRLGALAGHQATTAANAAAAGFDTATLTLISSRPGKGGGADSESTWDSLIELDEKGHAVLGAAGADGILWAMGKGLDNAEDFVKELPKTEAEWLHEMAPWGKDASDDVWADVVHRWFMKSDAAEGFGEAAVQDATALGTTARVLRVGGGPIAIAGDISTMVNPPQTGVVGDVDRGVALGNAGLVGADTVGAIGALAGWEAVAALSLGPVGVGLAVGTGLYLAGAYAYKHFAWFRDDLANPVGHALADVGHDLKSLF